MISIQDIRKKEQGILVIGNHPAIMQAILDFDFACGKTSPSIIACVTGNRKAQKFFFGSREVLVPCFKDVASVPQALRASIEWSLNMQSGRRAYESTRAFFELVPHAQGAHIFAENVPEAHAIALISSHGEKLIAGPSGVGLLVPGSLKLGAIGGTGVAQLIDGHLATKGSIAVVSTSGGMTNELITAVSNAGKRLSFAMSIGGDRFPITSLGGVLALAEADPDTEAILYFGELGGVDEYEIVEMRKAGKLTKPVIAYVAGVIDEAFDEHMQFGHAKALVARTDESARAKREALRASGAIAPDTFPAFLEALRGISTRTFADPTIDRAVFEKRRASILSTRRLFDGETVPVFVKGKKLVHEQGAFTRAILSALLGRPARSDVTVAFADAVFSTLIDHGGHVSGAVNTMITARAGKDLVASLASGILTVGPRFGGAVNAAAEQWLLGVAEGKSAQSFVSERTRGGALLSGIGHRKYRVGVPDPRVEALSSFATLLKAHPHYDFARAVEGVTTGKNGKLILNVDGVMAAVFLDILRECERMDDARIRGLLDAEFFNALFVIPRTVGFIAHYMEQKKNDEGLFRLPDDLLFERE
jgi:ATP citrate (pro-S)-lyase